MTRETTGAFDNPDAHFAVLVNDRGQYSLWPDFAPVPVGWSVALEVTDRSTCVEYVEAHWTDMRPRSSVDQ